MPNQLHEIAAVGDLSEGQMKEIQVADTKVLLSNVEGQLYATSAECPHYGMSLAEGLLCGKRVICPWHKAIFDVTDGAVLEPPALDGLTSYPLSIDGTKVLVDISEDDKSTTNHTSVPKDHPCFVLAGAGAAATAAAGNLRALGFDGRVVMLSGENELPYDRTALSKEVLSDKAKPEQLPLRSEDYWHTQHIERVAKSVSSVNPGKHELTLSDGSAFHYDKLLLATGANPLPVNLPGAPLKNVFTLRSLADAQAILKRAKSAERTVVVGSSFIAMEVASCFATQKLPVTAIVSGERPFQKQLGSEVGVIIQKLHEKNGVHFELNSEVQRLEGSGVVSGVTLKSGKVVPADLVVIGTGVGPVTSYAKAMSLEKDGGILVDTYLKAAEDIYAAGDVATFPETYSGEQARIEHWRVAEQHGRVAAANMLGAQHSFDAVPYFWTNHFDVRLDYLGYADNWDDLQLDANEGDFPTFIAFYFQNGKLVAAAACQRDLEICALHELFRLGRVPSRQEIRSGVNLAELLKNC